MKLKQPIQQLEKRKGGYFYFHIDADLVNQFEKKKATRLLCTIEEEVTYGCGFNHLGDGNFYIIIASKHLKKLGRTLGDVVNFDISVHPHPLGVEIPEVLLALIEQDEDAKKNFEALTDGKKRSLIYTIQKVKDIDKQVDKCLTFLADEAEKRLAKKKR